MTKFKLEITPGAKMVSANDFAGALERAAAKIREAGNDGLYRREQVEQVRDEDGATVGEWSLTDGLRTSEVLGQWKAAFDAVRADPLLKLDALRSAGLK